MKKLCFSFLLIIVMTLFLSGCNVQNSALSKNEENDVEKSDIVQNEIQESDIDMDKTEDYDELSDEDYEFSVKNLSFSNENIEVNYPEISFNTENGKENQINENILNEAISFGTKLDLTDSSFVASYKRVNPFGSTVSTLYYYEYTNQKNDTTIKSYFTVNINMETGEIQSSRDIVSIDGIAERIKTGEGCEVFDIFEELRLFDNKVEVTLIKEQKSFLEAMAIDDLIYLLENSYFDFSAVKDGGNVQAIVPVSNGLGDFIAVKFDW